ncbi:MAG: extracellular solute-binding protein, partial [Clostridiaceae bacterium]|nr:extracellular solute-binding protein [Clostridiaceae bacterium]
DHDAYYDVLGQTFASGELPDVVLLGSTYYAGYAGEDVLWDMTEVFENSDFNASGRLKAPDVIEGVKIDGKLFGMPVTRGNGCVTYVKQDWLDAVGMEAPTTYAEYLAMLEAFTTGDPDGNGVNGDTYGVSSAGIIGKESPFVNYLPEFYQDAYPSFYQKEDGTWADGFLDPNMEAALLRLREVYEKGYLDKESLTNGTKDCRNKYYEDKFGVFTYWAGKWNTNLKVNLEANDLSGELVALEPIAELDAYIERTPPVWTITAAAENPEGVFKYFFDSMFDGDKVQTLWTYGVKGIHWDDKAETVVENTYAEGEFHMLESLEIPGTQYTTAHIDPLLSIGSFTGSDPGAAQIAAEATNSQTVFNENSVQAKIVVATDEMSQYNGDLTTLKNEIVANVVTQGADFAAEMARFEKEGGKSWSDMIVESLNKN